MNRFEKGVDYPKSKKIPPWNNRAHVTTSTNNHLYHTHFKEFFDKRSGSAQYQDHLRYIYKTPSNGTRDHDFFARRNKYYWERREPLNPDSPERQIIEQIE